jgi:hypothetical protein
MTLKEQKGRFKRWLDLHKGITNRQRAFLWWFALPIMITVIIHFIFTFDGKPWWLWPLTALSLIFANWIIRKETREKWLPQKRELESLKKLMAD